jgi:hypothetical protein
MKYDISQHSPSGSLEQGDTGRVLDGLGLGKTTKTFLEGKKWKERHSVISLSACR